mgnify:CR=1 FL=1
MAKPGEPRNIVQLAVPQGNGAWPVVVKELVSAWGPGFVASYLSERTGFVDASQVARWADGEACPAAKHQVELKRLLATLYAKQLVLDLIDLEDVHDRVWEQVTRADERRRNVRSRQA